MLSQFFNLAEILVRALGRTQDLTRFTNLQVILVVFIVILFITFWTFESCFIECISFKFGQTNGLNRIHATPRWAVLLASPPFVQASLTENYFALPAFCRANDYHLTDVADKMLVKRWSHNVIFYWPIFIRVLVPTQDLIQVDDIQRDWLMFTFNHQYQYVFNI